MALKDKVVTYLLVAASFLGGKKLYAQTTALPDAKVDTAEVVAETSALPAASENIKKDIPEAQEDTSFSHKSSKVLWEKTAEGKEALKAYQAAMKKIGENTDILPEDLLYIQALYKMNREVAMLDGTGYTFDKEDLLGIVPDSLQNKLAEDASGWLTPSIYKGNRCNHAVKGNFFSNGLMLNTNTVSPACDMERYLRQDINFVGFEINPSNDCYAANGTCKVYRRTRAHPSGHIGIAVKKDSTEVSMDSSDKLRNNINEDNYSGVICFFTSHSEASFETCIAAWGSKYKDENRPGMTPLDRSIPDFMVGLRAKQVFDMAIACKQNYFDKYQTAMNDMPPGYHAQDGYIVGPSVKTPLLAYNVQRVYAKKKPANKKLVAQAHRSGQNRTKTFRR